MNSIILTIYPILFFVFAFYGAKVNLRGEFAPEHLSLEQTKFIQAVACVGIMIHHLAQEVTTYGMFKKGIVTGFCYIGFLFTALFFFFSGYGLIYSVYNKPDYLRTFLRKRLPTVYIPFLMINTLSVLLNRFVYGLKESAAETLDDMFGITLINSNGWFIIEIIFLYIIFYALFNLIKNKDIALVLLCIATVLLIIYSFSLGHDPAYDKSSWFKGEWWYNSTITFAFGMLYARFRDSWDGFFKKYYKVLIIIIAILSVLAGVASSYAVDHLGYYKDIVFSLGNNDATKTLLIQSVSCLICTTFIVLLNMKITIGNPAVKFISGISLELFLIHGYFINRVFDKVRMNDFLRFLCVIVCSIVATALISIPVKKLVKKTIEFLTWRHVKNDTLESKRYEMKQANRQVLVKAFTVFFIVVAIFAVFYLSVGRFIILKEEHRAEMETLKEAKVGDEVYFARFETDIKKSGNERLTWIVVKKEDGKVCLLSKEGLYGSYYDQQYAKVTWKESDLRELINTDEALSMFSKYERPDVMEVDGDVITLLTAEEAEEYFYDDAGRKLMITPYAEACGVNTNRYVKNPQWDQKGYDSSWWWLRGTNEEGEMTAPIVDYDGEILLDTKYVNKPNGAIRPVIWVKLPDE